MPKISLVIPHFQRFQLLQECIKGVLEDSRIVEIVISDDCSTDGSYEKLKMKFGGIEKVKLFRNEKNLDCYQNKHAAVLRSSEDWVILFDDDNVITQSYLDALCRIPEWREDTVYLPEFAMPHFNYTAYAGQVFRASNVALYVGKPHFTTMLNTANYFFHAPTWLDAFDPDTNPHTADSIYQAYNLLRAGNKLAVIPGLRYFHRVHNGSHYKNNVHKTGTFAREIENRLRLLR